MSSLFLPTYLLFDPNALFDSILTTLVGYPCLLVHYKNLIMNPQSLAASICVLEEIYTQTSHLFFDRMSSSPPNPVHPSSSVLLRICLASHSHYCNFHPFGPMLKLSQRYLSHCKPRVTHLTLSNYITLFCCFSWKFSSSRMTYLCVICWLFWLSWEQWLYLLFISEVSVPRIMLGK